MNALPNTPQTWLLVADGERVVVYVRQSAERVVPHRSKREATHTHYTSNTEWKLVPLRELTAEPAEIFEPQGDDGHVFDSAGYGRHGTAPKQTLQEQRSRALMDTASEMLNDAFAQHEFARLVIIAPPKLLGELRHQLDEAVRAVVVAELAKNLSHESPAGLVAVMNEALASKL